MGQNSLFGGPVKGSDSNAAEELATLDSAVLHDAVVECVRAGWMVSISASRDGFALRLAVMMDGDRQAVWLESADQAHSALTGLVTSAKAHLAGTEPARDSNGSGGRTGDSEAKRGSRGNQ